MFQIGSVIVCLIKEMFYYNLNVLKTWLDPDPPTQNHMSKDSAPHLRFKHVLCMVGGENPPRPAEEIPKVF